MYQYTVQILEQNRQIGVYPGFSKTFALKPGVSWKKLQNLRFCIIFASKPTVLQNLR